MSNLLDPEHQIQRVSSFEELISTPFRGVVNAACWTRQLSGDFSEIVNKLSVDEDMEIITQEQLLDLQLSAQGDLARNILINDLELLTAHDAAPILNLIKCYKRDESFPLLPTDVYSFHVDRSGGAMNTFLCTYAGASSDILPNEQAIQKVLIPEIRDELKKLHDEEEESFDVFLEKYYFDLHYAPLPNARPVSLGVGHLWRLAVDHPDSQVPPCIHRAPIEKDGERRLLVIC